MEFTIGGSFTKEFLIDSGANINIIPRKVWNEIWEDEDTFLYDVKTGHNQGITAYGGKPLKVFGTFKAFIEVPDGGKPKQFEEFVIVDEPGIALLSFNTALHLKVLKIGTDVNMIMDATVAIIQTKDVRETQLFPKVPGLKVRFLTDPSVRPIKNSSFRIPASLESEVEKQLEELERSGVIEQARHDSPWMSRMDIVVKDRTKWRLVLDMREVNKAIFRELYPFPTMERFVKKLDGARHFTLLDLKSAYHHIELDERSRDMTTFMTPKGPRRFTRLLFGVNCAPEIFQRAMDTIVQGIEGVIVYIDDILIFGSSIEELKQREEKVMKRLKTNNLTLNEAKCKREMDSVVFLGCNISKNGIKPSAEKVDAIKNFRKPNNKTELRSFIGLITFISPSLKGFAQLMEPLNRLLKKDTEENWGQQQDEAFKKIKEVLENEVVTRAFFNVDCKTKIYTDASPTALGAVLVQRQIDPETGKHKDRVVACASKTLTDTERRYPQTQKEALAIVWGVEKFNYYLLGRQFDIFTDHQPLEFIFSRSKANDKRSLTRAEGWALRLSMYNFKMHYVPTKKNIADPLSRMCEQIDEAFNEEDAPHEICFIEQNVYTTNIGNGSLTITADEVKTETEKDDTLQAVTKALQSGKWPETLQKFQSIGEELSTEKGFVLRGNRFILPSSLREKALEIAHESHPGITTMKRFLRNRLWWPGMDSEITQKAQNCVDCVLLSKDSPPAPMKRTPLPHTKWDYIAIDFYSAKNPDFIILVVVDFFSRFTRATFVKSTDFKSTVAALSDTFNTYGNPRKILADNGPPFQSAEFKAWCTSQGIKLVHSTPLWPRQNGMVERFMLNITRVVAIAKHKEQSYKEAVNRLIYNYNRRPHSTTGEIPMKAMLGREIFDQLPSTKTALQESLSDDDELDGMRIRDAENKAKGKQYSDNYNHARKSTIQPGDRVVTKNHGKSKLMTNFNAREFKVMTKKGEELLLKDDDGGTLKRNSAQTKKLPAIAAPSM